MLKYHEALELILSKAVLMPAEKVNLNHALKRVLAIDVHQDRDMPPFHKSAMDGYACMKSDLVNELEIVETVYAGKNPEKKIQKNQCYKIMTGAVVPESADFVFPVEIAVLKPSGKVICNRPEVSNNICYRGEDIKEGEKILSRNELITARHLPVLAGAGITEPEVYARPQIAVTATGTELVEPDQVPQWYQIRNSNSSQLMGQLSDLGLKPHYQGILPDEPELLSSSIRKLIEKNQVIIFTGGVSVGEYDLLPDLLMEAGFEIHVSGTAIKPGKPMVFASLHDTYCFGLSGNPVSSFIQFELYVKPFLHQLMGHSLQPMIFRFPLGIDFNRKNADRINFLPANISSQMEAIPVDFHGSAHIHALSQASCLVEVPEHIFEIKKGELVNVRFL